MRGGFVCEVCACACVVCMFVLGVCVWYGVVRCVRGVCGVVCVFGCCAVCGFCVVWCVCGVF